MDDFEANKCERYLCMTCPTSNFVIIFHVTVIGWIIE